MFGLFSNDDGGCDNHHWGDGEEVAWKFGTHPSSIGEPNWWRLYAKVRYQCQHDGCTAMKEEWEEIKKLPKTDGTEEPAEFVRRWGEE